ncbi:calcium-dependent phosphotriesterase [Peniophora sp. CONT]|nr:calcium-dependent phosphotriesterase [Peniophora sp. CONT]
MFRFSSLLAALVVALAVLSYRARYLIPNVLLPKSGLPSEYYYGKGSCRTVQHPGVASCEDGRFWDNAETGERRLILSCDPGRRAWNTVIGPLRDPLPRGALWFWRWMAVETLDIHKIELVGFPGDHTFHPLGFEASPARSGKASRLFVVNHARNTSVIEEFTLSWDRPTSANWIRTLDLPFLNTPNAISLTSDNSFYVSNDHHYSLRHGLILSKLETFLALPLSHVEHVHVPTPDEDAQPVAMTVAGSIPFANGVALSPDGALVAVASTTGTSIRIYARHTPTNSLLPKDEILVPFAPDNLSFDDDGVLLVAGHADMPALTGMAEDKPGVRAPSWVMSLRPTSQPVDMVFWDAKASFSASGRVPPPPTGWEMETLYQSNGHGGFASSVSAFRDARTGRLFVTGLYEEGLLVCD